MPSSQASFRFLIDDEMFDTDEDSIEALAPKYKKTPEQMLSDANKDGFIDIPGGEVLHLPTGQQGDEGLFDTEYYKGAFPFGGQTPYSPTDFLAEGTALQSKLKTKPLQNVQWNTSNAPQRAFVGQKVLDPVPGVKPHGFADYNSLGDHTVTYVSPVFKSDVSMQEKDPSKYGSTTANLQGERRGLVAFQILSVNPNPNGGSYLPYLTIRIVDPATVNITSVGTSSSSSSKLRLVQ